jgi:hypothetical protein
VVCCRTASAPYSSSFLCSSSHSCSPLPQSHPLQ